MVLDHARWLRRNDRTAEALALWQRAGEAAQRDAPPDELAGFWTERNLLARRLLRDGNAAGAYALAAQHGQVAPEQMLDAEFLAGFIALRRLNDPAGGDAPFHGSGATVQGRRSPRAARITGSAAPLPPRAVTRARNTNCAAAWPTTFYGQLAALALGDDAAALGAPDHRAARSRRIRASRCWHSPTARWCAPRRCWSPGTIRTGRAPSCCGWTSWRPIRRTAR